MWPKTEKVKGKAPPTEIPTDVNPHSPAPAQLGVIYTGSSWEPSSDAEPAGPMAPVVSHVTPQKFEPRVRISRWQQVKNASKFSIVMCIFPFLVIIGIFTVIGLMAEGIIPVEGKNATTQAANSTKMPRDFAILPIEALAEFPSLQTLEQPSFTRLPTVLPDVQLEPTIAARGLSSTVKSVTTLLSVPTSSRVVSRSRGVSTVVTSSRTKSSKFVSSTTFITRTRPLDTPTRLPSEKTSSNAPKKTPSTRSKL